MSKLTFQPAQTQQEIAKVAYLADVIWNECYASTLTKEQIGYMVEKFQSEAAIAQQIQQQGYQYYLVQNGDESVGYFGVQAKDGKLLLSKIYLLAAQRGQGFTGEVFGYVDKLAQQNQCNMVWLTVNRHNQRAQAAYQKYGFTLVREQVVDIGGGFVMDDFVFEKNL